MGWAGPARPSLEGTRSRSIRRRPGRKWKRWPQCRPRDPSTTREGTCSERVEVSCSAGHVDPVIFLQLLVSCSFGYFYHFAFFPAPSAYHVFRIAFSLSHLFCSHSLFVMF